MRRRARNLKDGILKLSEELFREKFKVLSADERANLENKKFLLAYIEKIKGVALEFENKMTYGKLLRLNFLSFELTYDMFYRKGQGAPRLIRLLSSGTIPVPNSYVREILNDPPRWATGTIAPQLQDAIT